MRKKDLRVVGKPSTEGHYVLQDPPIPPKPQSSPDGTGSIVSRFIALRTPKPHRGFGCLRSKPEDDTFMKETEDAPSSERRILGGIGESRRADSESGRSMVETLGVLAIMGVLAIGGIMAYRYAVTKYQANETFNELRRRVVVHSQQSIIGTPLSQVEMGDTTQLGYPIAVARVDSGFFELTLQDIDKRLCQEMVRTGWTLPTQTRVNGVVVGTNPEACGEENSLVFRFQTEMGGCKTDADCPCGTCENGTCRTSCSSGESCVKNFDDGQYVCCPSGKVVGNSCCEYPGENGTCCDENSANCCPPDKPIMDRKGRCHACDEAGPLDTWGVRETCIRCAGWFIGGDTAGETGGNHTQGCWRCDNTHQSVLLGAYTTDETNASCQACDNRILVNNYCAKPCPPDKPIMDGKGECHACDEAGPLNTWQTAKTCLNCPGWFIGGDTGGSEDGNPGGRHSQGCYRCDDDEPGINMGITGDGSHTVSCQNCPNRILLSGWAGPSLDFGWQPVCAKLCDDGHVMDHIGHCHSCFETEDFEVYRVPIPYKCACPGVRYLDGDICKKCPEDLSALTPEQQAQCGG